MAKQSSKPGNMLYPVPAVLVSCRNKEGKDNVLAGYGGYQARQLIRMLHLEHFTYDLEELERTGEAIPKESHRLFDYQKRHPLTKEAAVVDCVIA